MTVDVDFDHLADIVIVRFLHCQVTLYFPFQYCTLQKKVSMCNLHLSVGSYAPSSLRWSISINYLEFFCTGDLCFLPPCINVFSYLFISLWTHEYLYFEL